MKRTLIGLALAGLLANAAFADATLTGDDSYEAVHLNATESTSYQAAGVGSFGQEGIYNFNP